MKGLGRRLRFYFIGFGLGLVLVWATLLRNRERSSWLPEGRVIEFLEKTDIAISDKAKCELECLNIDLEFMDIDFWKKADVNFPESATDRKPCPEYYITSSLSSNQNVVIFVETCDVCEDCEKGTATLRSIELIDNQTNCDCP